jgi:hypothetical protein
MPLVWLCFSPQRYESSRSGGKHHRKPMQSSRNINRFLSSIEEAKEWVQAVQNLKA